MALPLAPVAVAFEEDCQQGATPPLILVKKAAENLQLL
jgi:hypothetical protein